MKSFKAVPANLAKFNPNLVIAAPTIINPGPAIKLPIPVSNPLPTVSPTPSIIPPLPKDSIAVFKVPKTFLIAGSKAPPPKPAPAEVKLAILLLTKESKVLFNSKFLW